ncbi:MAG: stage IV sporulation protein A [Clostridia bacterium]|nr:stage IV sporulation protein A [Clostridia bacterium]
MTNAGIYKDIATRTGGDIYIGVVGPVRTGKSTFIKRFMDTLVIPNITEEYKRERATDELPQSSAGRTIMTTEPKFIPEDAVELTLEGNTLLSVRMIDCVGYIVPSSLGYIENDQPRMVKTPWFEKEIPFDMAAEIGTQKVINEHSTIGLVVTTDGSISDIPREEYEEAEERVINELKQLNKPFVVLLNCKQPSSDEARKTACSLCEKYGVTVVPVNCLELTVEQITSVLSSLLYEFPIHEIKFNIPGWLSKLPDGHWLRKNIFSSVRAAVNDITRIKQIDKLVNTLRENEAVVESTLKSIDLACGKIEIDLTFENGIFYKVISEQTGLSIKDEQELMSSLMELSQAKKEFERFRVALDEVEKTGYGIVMPTIDELSLEEPEIMKQGGRYGVRLKASAPSIHMMKADITTEVAPIVGTEDQSEELVMYLLKEFDEEPSKIWESNMFGKTLHSLVNEGLHNKLYKMPSDARQKLQETLERVINEGCSGLICIIL